ncbi:hypothetical protein ACHAPG_003848 [Botrytis cinerea]
MSDMQQNNHHQKKLGGSRKPARTLLVLDRNFMITFSHLPTTPPKPPRIIPTEHSMRRSRSWARFDRIGNASLSSWGRVYTAPGRLLRLMRINKVAFTDLTTLVLDEANVLAGDEANWPELMSQGGIVDAIGTLPIRRILVAPTRVSEHTDAGRRWLSSSYRSITTVSETDMTSLLHIASGFLQVQYTDRWSELYALFDTIVELLHKSTEICAGLKNILVFLDTREETELPGKLIEYDGYVTLPFNGTDLNGEKLGEPVCPGVYYPYTSKSRLHGSPYSHIHEMVNDDTRNTVFVCGATDTMKDGVDAPFDLVLQFLKRPCKYKDCTHEKILETSYSRAGRVGRYDRTGISYTLMGPGVDDYAAAEFIKVAEAQGDAPMQWLLDAKTAHERQELRYLTFAIYLR